MSKKIKPFPGNPRKITAERLRTLGESLNEYGSLDGFVVNIGPGKYENCIISGNQKNKHINLSKAKIVISERYETPTETGTTAIGHVAHNGELFPYREVIWDDRKCEIGNIRANNLGGRNDVDLLNQFEADILEAGGIDMDFEVFVGTFMVGDGEGGMPNNALNSEAVEDDFEPPAEIEEIQTDIVLGDLFEIGTHRLLCGDSTKAEDVDRLMGGEKADMCLTDPPYGVSYSGKTKDALKIENDALTPEQTHKLWERALDRVLENLKDGGAIYATVPAGLLQVGFMSAMESRGCLRQCMVWDKGQMVLGHSDYHYAHEPILYGWKKGAHYFTPDRTKTTVLRHKKPARNAEHPTMKPVLLWCEMMENSSRFGEICVDPFCGSGTTMVAAHQLNRRCFGMEISPKYCQVILDRMRKLAPDLEVKKNGQPYKQDV